MHLDRSLSLLGMREMGEELTRITLFNHIFSTIVAELVQGRGSFLLRTSSQESWISQFFRSRPPRKNRRTACSCAKRITRSHDGEERFQSALTVLGAELSSPPAHTLRRASVNGFLNRNGYVYF